MSKINKIELEKRNNVIREKFNKVYNTLIESGKIKNKSDLANHLESYNHIVNNMVNGKRNPTIHMVYMLVQKFNVNANYLLNVGEDRMFRGDNLIDEAKEIRQSSVIKWIYDLPLQTFTDDLKFDIISKIDEI